MAIMDSANSIKGRLEALRQKEAALKVAIATEKVRQQKRQEKDDARLHAVIGQAFALYAAQSPDFQLMLKQVLRSATMPESDRAFLTKKGWL